MENGTAKPRVGILKCGHTAAVLTERHGDYTAWFRALLEGQGLDLREWVVVDMDFPASVTEADGWLLTGSPLGVYEDHAFVPRLETFIREAYAAGVPVAGICFGHQVIAKALGGRVAKFPGGWSLGRQPYAVDGLGDIHLNAWHQDQVLEAPEGAEIIASGRDCAIAGLRMGDSVLTLQAHPEITNDCLRDLVEARRGGTGYAPGQLDAAAAAACEPIDSARVADWLGTFFRAGAVRAAAG